MKLDDNEEYLKDIGITSSFDEMVNLVKTSE